MCSYGQASHAAEINELEALSHSLWERLCNSQQRSKEQETELSILRAQQPRYANQIKKLTGYVKGLTNDQHGLRDSFTAMERLHSAAHESKRQVDSALQDVRAKASIVDTRTTNALKNARHEIENLTRIVQEQKVSEHTIKRLPQYRMTNTVRRFNLRKMPTYSNMSEIAANGWRQTWLR